MVNQSIERKAALIRKYIQEGLSGEEQAELDQWIATAAENKALLESLSGFEELIKALADYAGNKTKIWEQITTAITLKQTDRTTGHPHQ